MKTNRFHFFKPYIFKIHSVLLWEQNGNLCLGLIKYDSTKAYGEVEERLHVFFLSEEVWGEWRGSSSGFFTQGIELPVPNK